jgi:hypothetical protein
MGNPLETLLMTENVINHRDIYDTDFLSWIDQQTRLLRTRRFAELDCTHLIEELEDMGREQKVAIQSLLRQILIHLLKLQCSPAVEPRTHWIEEVAEWRDQAQTRLDATPSLKHYLNELFDKAWLQARRSATKSLQAHGESVCIPLVCPYTVTQTLDHEFFPQHHP